MVWGDVWVRRCLACALVRDRRASPVGSSLDSDKHRAFTKPHICAEAMELPSDGLR